MRLTLLFVAVLGGISCLDLQAQRRSGAPATVARGGATGSVALAVAVADPAGAPLGGVKVTVEGPAPRSATTEAGRIAFENLPAGNYRLRFEREGFVTLERELTARGAAPIDVKVTLTPAPKPPPPPPPPVQPVAPPPPPPPAVNAEPVTIDLPGFIQKNLGGRSPAKSSSLACSTGGTASLIYLSQPLAEHVHADADEFLYVIAGEGTARVAGGEQRLYAGVFMLVPRGVPHTLTRSSKTALVMLSTRAGEPCAPPQAGR